MKKELQKAKKIIKEVLAEHGFLVRQIILFGSRVKQTDHHDSDWDFLVIVNKEISFPEKRRIALKIRRKLAFLNMPSDILIKSEELFKKQQMNPGYIAYYALKEGILL